MELKPGIYLQGDKYRIIKVLGNGGFGITYLAEHEMAGRNVCIKEFFPKEYYNRTSDSRNVSLGSQGSAPMMDAYKAKFIKEAKTIARLDHPNIIHIHDVFTENNTAYYVMEYIEGEPFSEIVSRDGAMKEADAVEYIRIVASAIAYIHEQRIMHLDIKPANVMLRKRDNRAILIDFGLSKQYDGDGHQTSSTPVGISAGYAPMEQYQQGGVKEFSPETDIYSLGATLYTLVTGAIPPQAAIIADEGFPELPSHLSAGVRRAIETSMLIQRRRRPHSTEEFLALLDNNVAAAPIPGDGEATILPPQQPLTPPSEDTIITPPVKEQPKVEPRKAEQPKPTPTPTTPKKRSKWWLWLLLLLIAVGGIVGYMMSGGDNPEPTSSVETTYSVGDYYNENGKEGVVFEVWDGGRHGKIISLDETQAAWDSRVKWYSANGYSGGTRTYADSESDGKANTDNIMVRSDSEYFDAFKWCRAKGSSWYLPALDELLHIYINIDKLNSTLSQYGTALSDDCWYWSSTEYVDYKPEFCAWYFYMHNSVAGCDGKNNDCYVRAVSAF